MEKGKIALLVDVENMAFRYIEQAMKKIKQYQENNQNLQLTHKIAFANWNKISLSEYSEQILKTHALKQQHTPAYSNGKNSADISLVIYAMEAALVQGVDTFVLMTNDSDFTELAYKLTELGKTVIVCGCKEDVALSLQTAGHEFWDLLNEKQECTEIEKKDVCEKKLQKRKLKKPSTKKEKNTSKKRRPLRSVEKGSEKEYLIHLAKEVYSIQSKNKKTKIVVNTIYSLMVASARRSKKTFDYRSFGQGNAYEFLIWLDIFNIKIDGDDSSQFVVHLK